MSDLYQIKPGQVRANTNQIIYLDPAAIVTSPYQIRETYSDLDQLADSLLSEGQQIPIRVWFTPTSLENGATCTDGNRSYIIYCHDGNRRLAAFRVAQLKDPSNVYLSRGIKALVIAEISSEPEAIINQYALNNTSRSFNALEEAKICEKLLHAGYTQTEIGQRLGKSQQWVRYTLDLLTYSEDVKNLIRNGQLSSTLAAQLIKETSDKHELEEKIIKTAQKNGKVTKSKLSGVDGRSRKAKSDKSTSRVPTLDEIENQQLELPQAVRLLFETTTKIRSINNYELEVVVPKSVWHALEDLL